MITTNKKTLHRRRKKAQMRAALIIVFACLVVVAAVAVILWFSKYKPGAPKDESTASQSSSVTDESKEPGTDNGTAGTDNSVVYIDDSTEEASQTQEELTGDELLRKAKRLAAMYDYDTAISLLQDALASGENEDYQKAITQFQTEKLQTVKWSDNTAIPHVFFHTLVNNTALAFDGDYDSGNYNQVMTTVDEFTGIIQEMYDRGYVLVSIYDIAKPVAAEDGTVRMVRQEIYLPEGKKPFVLSQDDVSYYEYMLDDGFPNRLVIDDDGRVTCEIDNADGTTSRGSYDLIPLLDDFIDEHPDFSYKGAKGIIALTGYNGVFGYRTSEYNYGTTDTTHSGYLRNNPNIEADRQTAKAVADALKADGWLFATHGWGHKAMGKAAYDSFVWDINKWVEEVVPIIGETDIVIYPNGDDIGSWRGYDDVNQSDEAKMKYAYLESLGFRYFCNVDGSKKYWVQIGSDYVRMGRRNLDGTRMYEAVVGYRDLLDDLFDSKVIFDKRRPTPVAGVPIPEGYSSEAADQ